MNWWKDESGLAMTEGVIVIPFFLIVWIGLNAVSRIYEHRLQIEADAAQRVLSMASSGDCSEVAEEQVPGAGSLSGREGGLLSRIAGVHPLVPAHSRVRVTGDVTGLPPSWNGGTVTLGASRVLMCNTKPVDGLMDLIVSNVRALLGV